MGLGGVLATVSFVAYLLSGVFAVFHSNLILGDALARVENVNRILFSHDPHLAAIGFAWGPLPALVELPLVCLRFLWPQLVTLGLAANLMSAAFMAAAVYQLHVQLRECGIGKWVNFALVLSFAANPMIFFYGLNGMSEAPFIFFLFVATRYLVRWIRTSEIGALVASGAGLGAAYLCRYEALVAGIAAIALCFVVTCSRTACPRSHRSTVAVVDALILGAPFLLAVALWSAISWLITGHLLDQFSSIYGTRSQLEAYQVQASLAPSDLAEWSAMAFVGILALAPLVGILILISVVTAVRHRDVRPIAVLSVFGTALAANYAAYASGLIVHTIRYFILAVPLATLLGAFALEPTHARRAGHSAFSNPSLPKRIAPAARSAGRQLVVIAMMAVAWPTGVVGLVNTSISPEFEGPGVQLLSGQLGFPEHDRRVPLRFVTDRQVAEYIDALHSGPGTVLVDDFDGYAIVVSSSQPAEFVITSDRDFTVALSDPAGYGIQYVLVPEPTRGKLDAINRRYPDLYWSGAGIGQLVREFDQLGDIGHTWRLYRVLR